MVKQHLWKLIVAVALAATLVTPGVSAIPAVFQSPPPVPPPNDNFASATVVTNLPFSDPVDITYATTQDNEPQYCSSTQKTVWYSYTPSVSQVVKVTWSGFYEANLAIYQAYGTNIGDLSGINCTSWSSLLSLTFTANAGTTYYFQIGSIYGYGQTGQLTVEAVVPPANDNFADAKLITTVPYDDNTDMTGATRETNEPTPSCGSTNRTIWYAYTPAESGSFSQRTDTWSYTVVGVYTGSSVGELQEVACRSRYSDSSFLTFHADANTTYYFQLGANENNWVPFHLQVAEPPYPNFGFYPSDPNIFDTVTFDNYSWDPANTNLDLMTRVWDFGDGTILTVIPPTNEPWSPTHRYAKDGEYTVKLTVTTIDARTASMTQTVHVKTHDVAITKFSAPQSASVNQTRQLVVGINSKTYAETVRVEFYKSVPGGYTYLGYQDQSVPVRSANRTTNFQWSYTFTKDDATIGKVTFKAVAWILDARDALPADNESIASPTKVAKK